MGLFSLSVKRYSYHDEKITVTGPVTSPLQPETESDECVTVLMLMFCTDQDPMLK